MAGKEAWPRRRLGDLLQSCDYGLSCALSTDPNGLPVLRMGNLQDGRISMEDLKYVAHDAIGADGLLARGDILLNRTNSRDLVGKIGLVSECVPATFASYLFRLRVTPTGVSADWLAQYLGSPACQKQLRGIATPGVSQSNINRGRLCELLLAVPSYQEQRKIAAILSSVDDAIEASQAVIDQIQVVKKAMMAELLTKGLPGRHHRFKQTEIGEVPEAWEVGPVGSLVSSCDYGLSTSLHAESSGIAVLRMGNLGGGRVSLDDLKFADEDAVDQELMLRVGDVLFNRTNSKDLVGKVGVFTGADFPVSFASYLLRLRPEPTRVLGPWVSAVMNLEENQHRLRAMATPGVSQVNINRGKMLALLVPVPSVDEQREVLARLNVVDHRLERESTALDGLKQTKAALMSVLLTGELRVRVTQEAAA